MIAFNTEIIATIYAIGNHGNWREIYPEYLWVGADPLPSGPYITVDTVALYTALVAAPTTLVGSLHSEAAAAVTHHQVTLVHLDCKQKENNNYND